MGGPRTLSKSHTGWDVCPSPWPHWQLPGGSEMQFPRPGVARLGACTLGREGASGGGGASPAQRAPKPAASPPLTLGPRLHPSPAAQERSWLRARSVLTGLRLGWGASKVRGWGWGRGKGAHKRMESGASARSAETRTATHSGASSGGCDSVHSRKSYMSGCSKDKSTP